MGSRKERYGWVDPRDETPSQGLADTPTKVVEVDRIGLEKELIAGPDPYAGSDATALVQKENPAEAPIDRRSAQYIPVTGVRRAGEATAVWEKKDSFGLKEARELIKARISKRNLILFSLLFAALPVAFVIPTFLQTQKEGSEETFGSTPITVASEAIETPNFTEATETAVPRGIGVDKEDTPPTLKAAADALIDGELEEALRIYERLARDYPEDESLALAVEILLRGKRSGL